MYATINNGKQVYIPTEEEGAILNAAALGDSDNPPLTDEQLAQMRPACEVLPPALFESLVKASRVGRPLANGVAKKSITIRIDEDLIEQLRASGKGWQTRLNAHIRQWINEETKASEFAR